MVHLFVDKKMKNDDAGGIGMVLFGLLFSSESRLGRAIGPSAVSSSTSVILLHTTKRYTIHHTNT